MRTKYLETLDLPFKALNVLLKDPGTRPILEEEPAVFIIELSHNPFKSTSYLVAPNQFGNLDNLVGYLNRHFSPFEVKTKLTPRLLKICINNCSISGKARKLGRKVILPKIKKKN